MVPDVHHILTKGQGVFCSAGGTVAKPKLRCAYEVFPLAYIVEVCRDRRMPRLRGSR